MATSRSASKKPGASASPASLASFVQFRSTLGALLDANVPVVLWGAPGIGKTRMIEALAAERGWHCETVLGSIREPQDIAGFPAVTPEGGFSLLAPDYARRIIEAVDRAEGAGGGAVLFLDEVSNCSPAQQAALLRVGTDRVIGDTALPAGCRIVFAANPPDQAADGWELSAPLANRMVHLEVPVPDAAEWVSGLLRNWGRPDVDAGGDEPGRRRLMDARVAVAGFISARPQLLHKFPDNPSQAGGAWPSPRSWADLVVPALASAALIDDVTLRQSVVQHVVVGAVGAGAGWEFLAWLGDRDLPDAVHLLDHPDTFVVPERPDRVHAVLAAVTGAAIFRGDAGSWAAAWELLGRCADANYTEIAAASARALLQAWPAGAVRPPQIRRFRELLRRAGLLPMVDIAEQAAGTAVAA